MAKTTDDGENPMVTYPDLGTVPSAEEISAMEDKINNDVVVPPGCGPGVLGRPTKLELWPKRRGSREDRS
jgi:hypothetical protein